MKENNTKLRINLSNDYNVKFEEEGEFKNSFFKEIYERAADNVNEILRKSMESGSNPSSYLSMNSYNNVISFIGDRGTGKSSSMISFCDALINKNENSTFFDGYTEITNTKFVSLGIVDPSLFHQDDNLFEIIISKMFADFQSSLIHNSNDTSLEMKGRLIEQFQKVYDNLRTVNRKEDLYQEEAIDALANLAFGTNLRSNFQQLIKIYNAYFDAGENGFLVIVIDDFDLNVRGAYQMLEDIRMYLITENVVIIIACKIDQLLSSLEEEIRGSFRLILEAKDSVLHELPKITAENYLEKLIPTDRRMHLPGLKQLYKTSNQMIEIQEGHDFQQFSSTSIESIVLSKIYQNTGVFILRPSYEVHPVTPTKLRSLVNSLKLYSHLNSSTISLNKLTAFFLDEDVFKLKEFDIFSKSMSDDKIDIRQPYHHFFTDFNSYIPDNLNQRIVEFLEAHAFLDGINEEENPELVIEPEDYFGLIIQKGNNPGNISMGDVMYIFKLIEDNLKQFDDYEKKFLFALKVFYNAYILKLILNGDLISIRKIFAGSILCSDYRNYLPEERGVFNFSFQNVLKLYSEGSIESDDLIWLFMFVTHVDKKAKHYRKNSSVYYNKAISNHGARSTENLTFSFMDFISNSFFPEKVAERLAGRIGASPSSTFVEKLKAWNAEEGRSILLYNVEFLSELIDKVSYYSTNYKEALPKNYSGILRVYIVSRMKKAVNEIIAEGNYEYLNLDSDFMSTHPVIKYWDDNRERIDLLLNQLKIQDNEVSQGIDSSGLREFLPESIGSTLSLPRNQIQDYLWRINEYLNNSDSATRRGVLRMSTIRLRSFEKYPVIHKELRKLKSVIDRDIFEGLQATKEYLKGLLDNG